MMTEPCAYHANIAAHCLAKTGHADDGATADRLRADLATFACSRYCHTATDNQEKP